MESTTSTTTTNSNRNPNPGKSSNVYQIGGVPVEFPYKPYGTQLAFMGRVISTLDRAKRNGRSHALLESPTGTGKTVSLLCSALAWQRSHASRHTPTPVDPLLHGGGFLPQDDEPRSDDPPSRKGGERQGNPNSMRAKRKLIRPTIYYASRTHAQISQVIREYRKTSYRVPMAILASRKHYCTNKDVCNSETVDEECKLLLRDENIGCQEYKNFSKVKAHPFLQKGGCYEAHDIEDLVKVGRMVKGCPYFAAQCMAAEADLVFCPYSYVINPVIRRAMDIDIKDAILILDEAHNIEDMAREAGSIDIEEDALFALQNELVKLSSFGSVAMIYQPLHDMVQGIISWINQRKDNLERHGFEHYCTCWTGDKAVEELQKATIDHLCFPILKECATKAIRAASDVDSVGFCLSGMSALILEGLFSALCFLLSENGRHAFDYQLALRRYVKRDAKDGSIGWTHTFSLWCLNPAIVFREIADMTLSVILSSGTLSPMGSFASELGVEFEACLEAPHVIDVESQLFAAVVATGPGNCQLNASYQASDGYAFQDALGASLEEIFKAVPAGILVFFPSYKLQEKLQNRWCQTGQWSRLNDQKSLFVEPRSKTSDFETILNDYYACIRGNKKAPSVRIRRGQKRNLGHHVVEYVADSTNRGAAFFAVCRGKVSEGIDFSDENARAVVIVGIPFPNITDIQVRLKKKYNDTYRSSKSLLTGSEWYCHQAFRALNQAAGRCIRHKSDYGAVILMDERFMEDRNLAYISRWIKKPLKRFDEFDVSLEGLRNFFLSKELLKQSGLNAPQTSDSCTNNLSPSQRVMLRKCKDKTIRKKEKISGERPKEMKPHEDGKMIDDFIVSRKMINGSATNGATPPSPYEVNIEASNGMIKASLNRDSFKMESCSRSSQICSSNIAFRFKIASGNCFATPSIPEDPISPCSVQQSRNTKQNFHPLHIAESDKATLEASSMSIFTTPERKAQEIAHTPEQRLSSSVDSCNGKRKKMTGCQVDGLAQRYCINSPGIESCCHVDNASDQSMTTPLKKTNGTSETNLDNEVLELDRNATISCMTCRTNLGLGDTNPVPCSLTSSSKVYLSALKYSNPSEQSLKSYSIELSNVPIVVCEKSCLDQLFLRNASRETSQDFWSEEDGCVFRVIQCPFCPTDMCLGLRIMAADAANTHLIDKVLFYTDRVLVRYEEPKKEATLPAYQILNAIKAPIPVEDFAYIPKSNNFGNLTKTKLRLPKRDLSSPKV